MKSARRHHLPMVPQRVRRLVSCWVTVSSALEPCGWVSFRLWSQPTLLLYMACQRVMVVLVAAGNWATCSTQLIPYTIHTIWSFIWALVIACMLKAVLPLFWQVFLPLSPNSRTYYSFTLEGIPRESPPCVCVF